MMTAFNCLPLIGYEGYLLQAPRSEVNPRNHCVAMVTRNHCVAMVTRNHGDDIIIATSGAHGKEEAFTP